MKTEELNLFIVDDDNSMLLALEQYLVSRFGGKLKISTFCDGQTCLNNINEKTDVVILDYFLKDTNGNEILRSIKERNLGTEIIMLSSNEDLETAVESFRLGAKNYIVKSSSAWRKISKLIQSMLGQPTGLINDFWMKKLIAIIGLTVVSIGVAISLFLKLRTQKNGSF